MAENILVDAIEKTGQANRLRHVYHKLAQPAKVVTMHSGDQFAQFWVPKRALQADIECFTESHQLQIFLSMLREGDVVWDVGANCGVYSMFAAKKISETGQVYCFEPQRNLQRVLKVNRLLNKLAKRVTILPIALGDSTGSALFYESAVTMGTHSLIQRSDDYRSKEKPTEVKISRADDLVRDLSVAAPDAIKIDVEGAEYSVCKGLERLIASAPPRLLFLEVHPGPLNDFRTSVEDLRSLLTGYGYEIADCGTRGTESYWLATRPDEPAIGGLGGRN